MTEHEKRPRRVWPRIARCVALDEAGRVSVADLGPQRKVLDPAYLRLLCEEHRYRDPDGAWAIRWPLVQFEYEITATRELQPDLPANAFHTNPETAWDTVLEEPDVSICIGVSLSDEARAILGDAGAGALERIAESELESACDMQIGMSGAWDEIQRQYESTARKLNLPIPGEPPRGPKVPPDRLPPRLPF